MCVRTNAWYVCVYVCVCTCRWLSCRCIFSKRSVAVNKLAIALGPAWCPDIELPTLFARLVAFDQKFPRNRYASDDTDFGRGTLNSVYLVDRCRTQVWNVYRVGSSHSSSHSNRAATRDGPFILIIFLPNAQVRKAKLRVHLIFLRNQILSKTVE